MNEKLIENWNKVVCETDIVYHLGDFCFGSSELWIDILSRLRGHIRLIIGNHDGFKFRLENSYRKHLDDIQMADCIHIDAKPIYLSHFPYLTLPKDSYNFFGHVHSKPNATGNDVERLQYCLPKQYDVGVDNNNYTPISFEQIKEKLNG